MLEQLLREAKRAAEGFEFSTFWVGVKASVETEKDREAKRELAKKLREELQKLLGREANPQDPDLLFVFNLFEKKVELRAKSIFIKGRYRKLKRDIPQTNWPCRECEGRGCERCGWGRKMYETSVEEIIAEPFLRATRGNGTRFHGMGREDVDVLMLGRGRPFVLEVLEPRVRGIDLERLGAEVNESGIVEVLSLGFGTRADVRDIKRAKPKKLYRAIVEVGKELSKSHLEKLKVLEGIEIQQLTPKRVSHRRAVKLRRRKVERISTRLLTKNSFELEVVAEAGTYIKELVSGDEGKTKPSIAEILGCEAKCVCLDVLEVLDRANRCAELRNRQ